VIADGLAWVPGWVIILVAGVVGWLLWRRARTELAGTQSAEPSPSPMATTRGGFDE
jgi:hypothetical protein